MSEVRPTVVFIADISGFTTFINDVDVEHSAHIISELLEIIIEANNLDLEVSEIEGDAVLFYRMGDEPTFEEVTSQTEEMFMRFHEHLNRYERDRICNCGACTTAAKLTLKFVYHFGEVMKRQIKDHEKLLGPDVTLAHRLLKNTINSHEYVLLSSLPQDSTLEEREWIEMQNGTSEYEGIGEVPYNYFSLTPLRKRVHELPPRPEKIPYPKRVSTSITINAPLEDVHIAVIDIEQKPKWAPQLQAIEYDGPALARVGTAHACITPRGKFNVEIASHRRESDVIHYSDKSDAVKWLAPIITAFTITKISDGVTRVDQAAHYRSNLLTRLYLDFPLRIVFKRIGKKGLAGLKSYLESRPEQTASAA